MFLFFFFQVESMNNDLKVLKQMKQKAVNELQEYKIHCLELKENFSMDKNKLEKNIREVRFNTNKIYLFSIWQEEIEKS